jgi:hypothetical protein
MHSTLEASTGLCQAQEAHMIQDPNRMARALAARFGLVIAHSENAAGGEKVERLIQTQYLPLAREGGQNLLLYQLQYGVGLWMHPVGAKAETRQGVYVDAFEMARRDGFFLRVLGIADDEWGDGSWTWLWRDDFNFLGGIDYDFGGTFGEGKTWRDLYFPTRDTRPQPPPKHLGPAPSGTPFDIEFAKHKKPWRINPDGQRIPVEALQEGRRLTPDEKAEWYRRSAVMLEAAIASGAVTDEAEGASIDLTSYLHLFGPKV